MSNQNHENGTDEQSANQTQQPQYQQPPYQQPPYQQPPYQQPQYQQPPYQQPPYQQPPYQQPQYQQPPVPTKRPASETETNGLFKTAGSVLMLILCIMYSLDLVASLSSNFPISILTCILPLLTLIGLWLSWAFAKKRKLKKAGVMLIRVPFIINFVFTVIIYAILLIIAFIIMAGASAVTQVTAGATSKLMIVAVVILMFVVAAFVFNILYFKSINNCLKNSGTIQEGYGVEHPSGKFAAVMMIIQAIFKFIPVLAICIVAFGGSALIDLIFSDGGVLASIGNVAAGLLKNIGTMTLISGIITFLRSIFCAVLILQFNKNTKV